MGAIAERLAAVSGPSINPLHREMVICPAHVGASKYTEYTEERKVLFGHLLDVLALEYSARYRQPSGVVQHSLECAVFGEEPSRFVQERPTSM